MDNHDGETPELKANNVKIRILGETDRLPQEVRESLLQGVRETEAAQV